MTTDTVGGVWNYALSLIRGLDAYGIEVVLATMGRMLSADQRREAEALPKVQLAESSFRLEWMDNPWNDITRAGEWLLELEDRWKPDVIHLNSYCHAALYWNKPKLVVAHSCVLSWWDAVRRCPLPDDWHEYAERIAEGLCAADLVVAPSAAMLGALRRFYNWSGPARVIWNAVSPVASPSCHKEPVILTAGRLWDEAKNLAALEEVAPELPWPVYAAGEDHSASPASVRRLGRLPATEVIQWMARAAIYVMPARYEPFGLSILEAAVSGCALVLGDIPSLRELWDGAALFVPPDDRRKLAHVLGDLIADAGLRNKLADDAQKRAANFSLERMARQYVTVYQLLQDSVGDGSAIRSSALSGGC